jgi:hypothetical protein
MMIGLRLYGWSLAVSVVLTALVAGIASLPHCSAIGVVLLPGALLAALVFPQGPESDAANVYLVLAGLLDSLLLAFPIMWTWGSILRRRKGKM